MLNTDIEYNGYLLRVHRIGTFGAYSCFAMKLREPGNLNPPYAGRIQAEEFKGKGAKRRAFDAIKLLVDEATNNVEGRHVKMIGNDGENNNSNNGERGRSSDKDGSQDVSPLSPGTVPVLESVGEDAEVKECERHGIYAVDECPGCSLERRHPEMKDMYDQLAAVLKRRESPDGHLESDYEDRSDNGE